MLTSMESIDHESLTSAQCRMARAALSVSIDRAAERSRVSRASITRFEHGDEIRPVLRMALRAFFEQSGVTFTTRGVEMSGIDDQDEVVA